MNSKIRVDRISGLPDNVKDSILTRLTIKEAVRTSILSQSWRYQWHSLSNININHSEHFGVSEVGRVKIIDHILLLHYGSLDKFKLDINFDARDDIDRWIIYLSRHGIKDLIIKTSAGQYYNLPFHLFSCSELTRLELRQCRFKPPPAAFKAFRNMTELLFDHVIIDNEALEKMINSCPLLSKLSLLSVCSGSSIRINAPKLVMLHMSDSSAFPLLNNTPLLESALFGLQYSYVRNFMIFTLLRSMPLLRRLELNHFALQHLAVGAIPAPLPLVCPVKHLILWADFTEWREMHAALCIFSSSPFIQTLDLKFVWEERAKRCRYLSTAIAMLIGTCFNFRFDNLQEVKLTNLTGTKYELEFIEFVLAYAPALETMDIKFSGRCKNAEGLFTIIKKLIRFPRASPKAELILPSNM